MERTSFAPQFNFSSAPSFGSSSFDTDRDKTKMIRQNFHLQQRTLASIQNPTLCPSLDHQEVLKSGKHANVTEAIPVPSSEHVAEIVGRQGCKIKELRSKTKTYIKTPQKGEEPVFVVTGRRDDVAEAKLAILTASDHFSKIRANRRPPNDSKGPRHGGRPHFNSHGRGFNNEVVEDETSVTKYVEVPMNLVGLVVGPRGATIKEIQEQTNTYIVSPGREDAAVFRVIGKPMDVSKAEEQINAFVRRRLSTLAYSGKNTKTNHKGNNTNNFTISDDIFSNASGDSSEKSNLSASWMNWDVGLGSTRSTPMIGTESALLPSQRPEFNAPNFQAQLPEFMKSMGLDMGDSSSLLNSAINSQASTSTCIDSLLHLTLSDNQDKMASPPPSENGLLQSFSPLMSNPWSGSDNYGSLSEQIVPPSSTSMYGSNFTSGLGNLMTLGGYNLHHGVANSIDSSAESSPLAVGTPNFGRLKICISCQQQEITTALAPCGHHLYCQDCAENIMAKSVENRKCAFCWQDVSQMYVIE